jgi:hypothetical protein
MSRARWENIIGGIIVCIMLFLWGLYLHYTGNWPFGLFWNIIFALCGGLSYIAVVYPSLKKEEDE